MKVLCSILSVLLLSSVGLAQQIGSVDLTHAVRDDLPYGCQNLVDGGLIGDGWAKTDGKPLNIEVAVLRTEDATLVLGNDVTAEVRLRNNDTRPIVIPWSPEFSAVEHGQQLEMLRWEEGTFDFTLKDQQGRRAALKSLTGSVYSSESSVNSAVTLAPDKSVTALVKFKLEGKFGVPIRQVTAGEWQLSAEWVQTGIARSISKDCGVAYFYSHYDGLYQQENPGITLQVRPSDTASR